MPKSISIPSDNRILRVPALKLPAGGGLQEGVVKAEFFQPTIAEASDALINPLAIGSISDQLAFKEALIEHFYRAVPTNIEILTSGLRLAQSGWGAFIGSTKNGWPTIPGTWNSVTSPFIRGWRFTALEDIGVTAFRYRAYTASRNHYFSLWDAETQALLATGAHFSAAANTVYTTTAFAAVHLQKGKDYIVLGDFIHAARFYYVTATPVTSSEILPIHGISSTADINTYPTTVTPSFFACVDVVYQYERQRLNEPSGTFELQSPVYSASSVSSSLFQVNTTLPGGTTVGINLDASFDGGVNWEGPVPCTHGNAVPHINGKLLDNAILKLIGTLTTADALYTPVLNSVLLRANY